MIFHFLSHFIFVEKPMENHYFWIFGIPKNAKTLFFPLFFAKNGNFDESASWWSEKKIFPSGSGGPKMLFNTILWYAAIKIWHRLIRFLHFWWFDFLIFWLPKKCQKSHLQKNAILQYFSPNFINFAYFLLFFSFFATQNPFLLSNFSRFSG